MVQFIQKSKMMDRTDRHVCNATSPSGIKWAPWKKLLCNCLKDAGYEVMNEVRWRFELSDDGKEKWRIAREYFQGKFPKLRKSESPSNSRA